MKLSVILQGDEKNLQPEGKNNTSSSKDDSLAQRITFLAQLRE
jgi:hypothetical protein